MPHLGEICALLAPLAWSVAVILFRQSGAAPPLSLNLFKNVLAVVLLGLTLLVAGIPLPADRAWADWARLIGSGLLGLALADTLLFEGLRRIGAARLAIVDTVYAPLVVVLSMVLLGERPTPAFYGGATAVGIGVLLATWEPGALRGLAGREIGIGMAYALAAISGTAVGVIVAKPVLEGSSLVEVTWTRLVAGVAGQLLFIVLTGRREVALTAFRPGPLWRTLVPGAFIGTYLSLLLWLGGFKWADASVAAVLNQMATVYLMGFARVFLHEDVRPRQALGGAVAAAGALWIVLSRV